MAPVCLCRYAQDGIYSHAGPVLIAVNPFKPVPLYAPDVVQRYKVMRDSPVDVSSLCGPSCPYCLTLAAP